MAARINAKHDEATRLKIQASQLINRLMEHALSEKELMTNSQVNAAKILLAKVIPDLSAVQHTGEVTHFVARVPEIANTSAEWLKQNAPQALQ